MNCPHDNTITCPRANRCTLTKQEACVRFIYGRGGSGVCGTCRKRDTPSCKFGCLILARLSEKEIEKSLDVLGGKS